jgi:hypothetical protein
MLADAPLRALWSTAQEMDHTLRVTSAQLRELKRKFVRPESFSREMMFHNMARRRVSVFRNVSVLVRSHRKAKEREVLIHALKSKFPRKETSRVQVGPSHTVTRLPVREIMRRWVGGKAIVGVTDLHIRGTRLEEVIDTRALSYFNTLILGSDDLALQEMMTLVIASPGNVTDSHTDDPDGTNHCFFGRKLWLAWDAFEGMDAGLEDVERQDVSGQAQFSIARFLRVKSARWFLVSTGDTLFLPGNLTHKVLTLEPYLGIGSFNLGLPNSLDSFTRWIQHGPLWSMNDPKGENAGLVDEAAKITLRIARLAQSGSQQIKRRWGFDYLHSAYRVWRKSVDSKTRARVMAHPDFHEIVEIAKSAES